MLIQDSLKVVEAEYFLAFYYVGQDAGFRFPADRQGRVILSDLPPLSRENYRRCCSKELSVEDPVLEKELRSWSQGAVCRCDCGQEYYDFEPHACSLVA